MSIRWSIVAPLLAVIAVGSGVAYLASRGRTPPPPDPSEAVSAALPFAPVPPQGLTLTEDPITGFPDLRSSTQRQLQLDRIEAAWKLPGVNLPAKVAEISDVFALEVEEVPNPRNAARKLKVLRAPLPFPVDTDAQNFRPEGMLVTIDDKPIPFGRGPAPNATRSTWRINGRFFVLSHPDMPAPGTVKVRYQGVVDALTRHDPAKSGLSPTDFSRYAMTQDGVTRHGLLMVAPTIGEWEITVPERHPVFEGWLALERAPIDRPKSDGAKVSLTVLVGDKETLVDSQAVNDPRQVFQRWRVDLGAWAGQSVKLRLSTEPKDTTTFDWVFVGSPTVWGDPGGDVRRAIVIALDTTRQDDLSIFGNPRPTTPEIDAWIGSGVAFDHTWSVAPRTRPSFRSSTTGWLPLDAVAGARNIGEVFAEHGFVTAGLVANIHLQPRFDFDDGFDLWWFDGQADAKAQVDRALGWLDDYRNLDGYLFLHIMDPHMAYDAPGEFRDRFLTDPDPELPKRIKRADVLAMMKNGTLDERKKAHLRALHDGELAYTSSQLQRLFDAVDRMPGRTLVVLYSDHGEEFWEHEGFEHNHSLYDELTRTVFALRPRGGIGEGRRISDPVSLMDLAPTLYDLYGFADAPPVHGRTLMPLLASGAPLPERALPVGYLQYSHERWGVIWNDHKYVLHTGTGREELYDLKGDPGEMHDLSEVRELEGYRKRLSEAHGVPVGPGWRIRLKLAPKGPPLRISLPVAAVGADVLDPESVVEHRANIEWGELPRRLPMEIASVTLSEDHKTLTIAPGGDPDGIVYVMFDQTVDPAGAELWLGDRALATEDAKRGRLWKSGEEQVLLDPGTIVVPPPGEAARMGIGPKAAGDEDDMEELCILGYVECPEEGAGGEGPEDAG